MAAKRKSPKKQPRKAAKKTARKKASARTAPRPKARKPAAKARKSAAKARKPAAKARKSAARARKPAAKARKPAARARKSAATTRKPAAKARPAVTTRKPASGTSKLATKVRSLVDSVRTLVDKVRKPAAKASPAARTRSVVKATRTASGSAARRAQLGRFVWFDLMSTDVPVSIAFYRKVFGWNSRPVEMGGMTYNMLSAAGRDFGGVVSYDADPGQSHWMPYVSVDDIDAACQRAERAGGIVTVPPMTIPGVGRCAVIADPLGGVSSPLQLDDAMPVDFDGQVPVGLVAWNEMVTRDPGAVRDFYARVYDWQVGETDMGMGTYYLFRDGPKDVAGMIEMPPGSPVDARPMWLSYVHVSDTDRTLEAAIVAGAKVAMACFDVPGVGRMAVFIDPAGAVMALLTPSS
jgi:uncharacterized protein